MSIRFACTVGLEGNFKNSPGRWPQLKTRCFPRGRSFVTLGMTKISRIHQKGGQSERRELATLMMNFRSLIKMLPLCVNTKQSTIHLSPEVFLEKEDRGHRLCTERKSGSFRKTKQSAGHMKCYPRRESGGITGTVNTDGTGGACGTSTLISRTAFHAACEQ